MNRRNHSLRTKFAAAKLFNLHHSTDLIDQVITQLAAEAEREPEIAAAVDVMIAAKRLLKAYSQRMLNEPFKSNFDAAPGVMDLGGQWLELRDAMKGLQIGYESVVDATRDEDLFVIDGVAEQIADLDLDFEDIIQDLDFVGGQLLNTAMAMQDKPDVYPPVDYPVEKRVRQIMNKALKKAMRGQYDNFEEGGAGFSSPSELFRQQHEDANEEELQGEYHRIEDETDAKLRGQGIDPCRDDSGQFSDC